MAMTWPFENRMAVEGQRYQEELYAREDDDDVTYCELYSCRDCPRYGDDCDGNIDDRIVYFEKEGDEYVYYDENDCELYREPA